LNVKEKTIVLEDIEALETTIDLIKNFDEKIIIKKRKFNDNKYKNQIAHLKHLYKENEKKTFNEFKKILRKLRSIVSKDVIPDLYYIIGGHGGVIINDIGFCEFDSPIFAIDSLLKKMQLAITTNMPYNLEIAVCCLEWLNEKYPEKISEFLKLFNLGKFEIVNSTYSQPYNLIISPESNLKQFEYGIESLHKLGLDSNIYYCSESSIHPQIPQMLKGFHLKYGSLRTRLLGVSPTSSSPRISWKGLDNTAIDAIIDQSGVFNGEYWHGMFFNELPSLLFQAVARPFMNHILYSSFDDFVMPQPYQEKVWRVSKFSNVFGRFLLCSEVFEQIIKDGEYKYRRDDFSIGDYVFLSSELFLHNKNSEICIITAEIMNFILGVFNRRNDDSFFTEIWKKLLLTQAHDCYAVPFIRTGDYSQAQFTKEVFNNLKLTENESSISSLSIQMHKEIQNRCKKFIGKSLNFLIEDLARDEKNLTQPIKSVLIFNPTIYPRNDIVSIQYINLELKFVVEIPAFAYKIFTTEEINIKNLNHEKRFLYRIKILEDLQTLEIKFMDEVVYELKFQTHFNYELILDEEFADNVEERNIIIGKSKKEGFKVQITQYKDVNRLEFIFDSNSVKELIFIPKFKINRSFINYPFGIEETKKTKIQTLDFLWLKGQKQGIIFVQKNSQQFLINHENFEIRNLMRKNGKYEFAISITDDLNSISPLFYVNSYYFKLLGITFDRDFESNSYMDQFISIEPEVSLINLWRRENGSYIRLFNPTNREVNITLSGKLVKKPLKELDFIGNEITLVDSNKLKFEPWKIKTIKF